MSRSVSLDSLDDVQIPDLDDDSKEEELFEATEAKSHKEHKLLEAHETTLRDLCIIRRQKKNEIK